MPIHRVSKYFLVGSAMIGLAACSVDSDPADDKSASSQQSKAAETSAPVNNSSILPVGQGGGDASLQTTLGEAPPEGSMPLEIEVLASGLSFPWSLSVVSEDLMLVTERTGQIRFIKNGKLDDVPISGGPTPFTGFHAGYLEILPHPDFEKNGQVYLSYAHGTLKNNTLRIGRGNINDHVLENFEVIYETFPARDDELHYGGKMTWGPDGKLYVSIGADDRERAQDVFSSDGAIIRLNADGSIPSDNPEWSAGPARPELFSKGHRNPQGLVFDDDTGALLSHEHGSFLGDELNIIQPGGNYGWPLASFGVEYSGDQITPYTEVEGTIQPIRYWSVPTGVSGMAIYQGSEFPEWQGDILFGGLRDMTLHRLDREAGKIVGEEVYLYDRARKIRDVRVGKSGAIYVVTTDENGSDEHNGEVIRITRGTDQEQ